MNINNQDQCPKGGSHDFEPDWKWDVRLDDYDFTDMVCIKCGELK